MLELDVANVAHDQQPVAVEPDQFSLQPPTWWDTGGAGEPSAAVRKATRCPA